MTAQHTKKIDIDTAKASFDQINPVLCRLYEGVYSLTAVLSGAEEINHSDLDEINRERIIRLLLDSGKENVNEIHTSLEQLEDLTGMRPDFTLLREQVS